MQHCSTTLQMFSRILRLPVSDPQMFWKAVTDLASLSEGWILYLSKRRDMSVLVRYWEWVSAIFFTISLVLQGSLIMFHQFNRYNSFTKITAFVLYCWICWICMDMLCSAENSVCLLGWVVLYFWLCIFPRTAVGLCCIQCEVLHGVHCFPTFLHTLCVTLHTVCKTQGV